MSKSKRNTPSRAREKDIPADDPEAPSFTEQSADDAAPQAFAYEEQDAPQSYEEQDDQYDEGYEERDDSPSRTMTAT